MNWYVKYEGTEMISGPMSKSDALGKVDRCEGLVFSEDIFSPKIVTTPEVDAVVGGESVRTVTQKAIDTIILLSREKTDLSKSYPLSEQAKETILQLLSSDSLGESDRKQIVALITHLSWPRVVTGTIEGGVLSLDEVPDGVSVDIRDYDTEGVDPELVKTDEDGNHFFEVG